MAEIKLTFIGTGDAFGSGGRLSTCFYVKAPDFGFLIDCGASSIPGLKMNGIDTNDIGTILITHFHGDHFAGLSFFLLEAAVYRREKPITIVSPARCKDKVSQLLSLLYPGTEVLDKLNISFLEYQPFETIVTGGLKVQAYPVIHSEASFPHGLRIHIADKIISYSGDTEWTDNLIPLSADADLFICECNFFNLQVRGHMNYQSLKSRLPGLTCKKIILTHFDNEMLNNIDQIDAECAFDGMKVDI